MRVFIAVLVLIFSLQSWAKADGIGELEIAGISIGDSLLRYVSKEKIEKIKSDRDGFIYNDKTFYSLTIYEDMDFDKYDFLQFHLKAKDYNYIIHSISGRINFKDDIKSCYKLMDEIVGDIKSNLNNYKFDDVGKRDLENQDGSIAKIKSSYFNLNNGGNVSVHCYDHPSTFRITDNLTISLDSPQFVKWLMHKAYK
jgi:hypothetical protein